MEIQNNSNTPKLPQRKIGSDSVTAIGFGLMNLTANYNKDEDPVEIERKNLEILTRAADAGETFWDTSDFYGPFANEELVGRWFKLTGRRNEIFLATKFGVSLDPETKKPVVRGDKDYVRQCIEGSLRRLGVDHVDLYYQHRIDKNTRVEDTVGVMAELVKEGKVRYLGLSECSAQTIRRAHAVHPIAAVQMEYSLFTRDIEDPQIGVKQVCDELGIAIVAYSPLSRGLLAGRFASRDSLKEGDGRKNHARFSEENFDNNKTLADRVAQIAERKGCTSGQLALAWLLRQGDNVIPLPGTRQLKYLEENLGALKVELSNEDVKDLTGLVDSVGVRGDRFMPGALAAYVFGDSL